MKKNVCVITGGGSGIGLATAKQMPTDKVIVISGRTVTKLENAKKELENLGYEVYVQACDTSNRDSVRSLAEFAHSLGEIKNVINCAGVSPAMCDKESIIRINALGTVYMNQEFARVMHAGSVIVDVSSNSAYSLPSIVIPKKTYTLANCDEEKFIKKMLVLPNLLKDEYKSKGLAYALSKNFAIWYAEMCAFEYGQRGIRVVSVSPGLIATDMGTLEAAEGSRLIQQACESRMGKATELGYAIATIADERNGYLAGVDILCDGGSTYGKKWKKFLGFQTLKPKVSNT